MKTMKFHMMELVFLTSGSVMRVRYFVNKKILVTTTMFFCSENNCGYIIQVCEQIKRISLKFMLLFY